MLGIGDLEGGGGRRREEGEGEEGGRKGEGKEGGRRGEGKEGEGKKGGKRRWEGKEGRMEEGELEEKSNLLQTQVAVAIMYLCLMVQWRLQWLAGPP